MSGHVEEVYLQGIATAVPENRYSQKFALEKAIELMADTPAKERFLTRVYNSSAIDTRYSVVGDYKKPPDERELYPKTEAFRPEPTTSERNQLFSRESGRLSVLAAQKLFAQFKETTMRGVSHLITVSCTGVGAPGIDLALIKQLGLSDRVHRFHLGFMGCYATFPALKMARDICRSQPDARVLVVSCELCSLHLQQKFELDIQVANALFADGVGAALISSGTEDSVGPRLRLDSFLSQIVADSENEMTWTVGQTGFDMRLSTYVPKLLEANIASVLGSLAARAHQSIDQIAFWAIHPGGKAILEKIETALGLRNDALSNSYEVLREYGNMSSTTILFVLDRILKKSEDGAVCAAAFGPGLTVEAAWMEKVS